MTRSRGFVALFGSTMALGLGNGIVQLTTRNSPIDLPLGLLSLLVGLTSVPALRGSWTGARWTYRATLCWAIALMGAAIIGGIYQRPYMGGLSDVVVGPVVLAVIAARAVYRARRRFHAPSPAEHR